MKWDVSHLQSLLWDALKGNSTTLTLESRATETWRTSSLENQLRLAKHHFGGLDPCWCACDGCIVMIPSWFCLLWSFLSWSFPRRFWENHTGNKILSLESQCSILHLGTGVASKAVTTLSEALEAQAVPHLWQKTWAELEGMEPRLHFPEREGREKGRKQNNMGGREKPTKRQWFLELEHEEIIGPQNPHKVNLLNYVRNIKIMPHVTFIYYRKAKIK